MAVDYPKVMRTKSSGLTNSESYLVQKCNSTFLSFWSYPNLYKKQEKAKELCDVLVIFKDHLFIFSDKTCSFGPSDDYLKEWKRWYKKAVSASAKQIYGAERWIKEYPERICMDRQCNIDFPIKIEINENTRIHRIIVAHGAKQACMDHLHGSGSLRIDTTKTINDIQDISQDSIFTVGKINSAKGYIHILDDITLDIIMSHLDTVMDFAEYLSRKEDWIDCGNDIITNGEEDLLAYYLTNADEMSNHCFTYIENEHRYIEISERYWSKFIKSQEYKTKKQLDKSSYVWDKLVEENLKHIMDGTSDYIGSPVKNDPSLYNFFVALTRFERRFLADRFFEHRDDKQRGFFRTRLVPPLRIGYPCYFFVVFDYADLDFTIEDPIKYKMTLLSGYLKTLKLDYIHYSDFIGLIMSTDPKDDNHLYIEHLDTKLWKEEDYKDAERIKQEYKQNGYWSAPTVTTIGASEYKQLNSKGISIKKGRNRNKDCFCGSGRKYKRCCGSNTDRN